MTDQGPQLPAVFGRYVLLHRLSRGGMGEVFLARLGEIQGFEKLLVIKKILPQLARDEDFLRRFIEEAQIAIKLSHGNIVPVYEVGRVEGEYFLALQYVEGRDLRTLLNRCGERQRMMPPELCLFLVREIANGLAYAHRRTDESGRSIELVHCDISPPNILVSYEGEVKIIDFGIAKSAMQHATAKEDLGFGKFGYMAPEQLVRGMSLDRRADIYSTGVILYEILTGHRLFCFPPDTDYRRVAEVVTSGRIAPPSARNLKLTERFDRLVMRALAIDPSLRYQSAEEFRDEIQQHLYAMAPTISTDTLADFVRELFAEQLEHEQSLLRTLSQTDMGPLQVQLSDASSHTVSFALGEMLSPVTAPGRASLLPPRAPDAAPPLVPRRGGGETRRLQEGEQRAALQPPPVAVSSRARAWLLLVGIVGLLISAGVIVGLLAFGSDESLTLAGPVARGAGDTRMPVVTGSGESSTTDGGPARPAPTPDLAPATAAPVDAAASHLLDARLASSSRGKTPRGGSKGRPVKRPVHPRGTKKEEAPSPEQVQRKFLQVRREFQQFTRDYGRRLDAEWQQILFSNTYGNMDESKYRRLDAMLDALRRRMKEVRGGG